MGTSYERYSHVDAPYELADRVPTWAELDPKRRYGVRYDTGVVRWSVPSERPRWVAVEGPNGEYDDDMLAIVDDDLTQRWWAAVAEAVKLGFPAHWADMGLEVSDDPQQPRTWMHDDVMVDRVGENRWSVDDLEGGVRRSNLSEFDARCVVAGLLNGGAARQTESA